MSAVGIILIAVSFLARGGHVSNQTAVLSGAQKSASNAAQQQATPLPPIAERDTRDPAIVNQNGKWQLQIPNQLAQAVKSSFPQFHLPDKADLSGGWSGATQSGKFPFITWADFNGDGLTDVAAVLLNDKEWRLAIFHQQPDGTYKMAHQDGGLFGTGENASIRAPQDIVLSRLKKDVQHTIKGGGQSFSYTFPNDALQTVVDESGLYIKYWKDGKYEELSFVD